MNKKYQKYIEYIVNELEPPYFINMRDSYGLSPDEYEMILPKIFKQPFTIKGDMVYNQLGDMIYYENSSGIWERREYNKQGKLTYYKNNTGYWDKYEYDERGKPIYSEDSNGYWSKREYDNYGNKIYSEDSNGEIVDNR